METVYIDNRRGSSAEFYEAGTEGEILYVRDTAATVYVFESAGRSFRCLERRRSAGRDYSSTAAGPVNRCRGE